MSSGLEYQARSRAPTRESDAAGLSLARGFCAPLALPRPPVALARLRRPFA